MELPSNFFFLERVWFGLVWHIRLAAQVPNGLELGPLGRDLNVVSSCKSKKKRMASIGLTSAPNPTREVAKKKTVPSPPSSLSEEDTYVPDKWKKRPGTDRTVAFSFSSTKVWGSKEKLGKGKCSRVSFPWRSGHSDNWFKRPTVDSYCCSFWE